MKILIRGAGDLATGIASRLYRAGHSILMTEIPVPLTVRRTVAFSRAVYEKTAQVEDISARLAETEEEAGEIIGNGDIAVMVDPQAKCRKWYQPDVIVDAILAKRNLGTGISDAPFVVGVGPGFTAGTDCHCIVETKRGHTLGSVIWQGTAIPNTGIPGNVGGFTIERLIRAAGNGRMTPCVQIGDMVEKGQIVAVTGEAPVYAQMSGIVRGMLQERTDVREGLKIGDIDARAQRAHCYTVSDKAKAIGGGVLEAVSCFERMRGRYAFVILAAGAGSRFGGSKLLALKDGIPLYEHMLNKMRGFGAYPVYIVTGDRTIAAAAEERGITPVWNTMPEKGIARSITLGLEAALDTEHQKKESRKQLRGALFSVCDQPMLSVSTIQRILNEAFLHPGSIVCAGSNGKRGNPVLWDRAFFSELMQLSGDIGGRSIMEKYPEKIRIVETETEELHDVDRREDLQ